MTDFRKNDFPGGSVWLVGAGPGDAELLTRKAERLIGEASVVFYDALVGADILEMAARSARLCRLRQRRLPVPSGPTTVCQRVQPRLRSRP